MSHNNVDDETIESSAYDQLLYDKVSSISKKLMTKKMFSNREMKLICKCVLISLKTMFVICFNLLKHFFNPKRLSEQFFMCFFFKQKKASPDLACKKLLKNVN
jgi:uncharacterized protein YfkK (UPF0435 family)